MRFRDAEGRTWIVRDVALLPDRTLVEPGNDAAVERYFENVNGERRLYIFAPGETRSALPDAMEEQLRAARPFTPQRQSDPNLDKV